MVTAKRQQQRYTNRDRKALLARFHASGCVNEKQFSRDNNVKYQTWQGLRKKEQQITSSKRHGRKATLGGQGRKPMIPFAADLLYYMRELSNYLLDSSVLLVDNLECHVSEKAHDKIAEASFSVIEPLPPNSTS
ncbi:hypothetical protein DYB28_009776, partial [Aphanomyces astaci]